MVHHPGDLADTDGRRISARRHIVCLAQKSVHFKDEAFVQQEPILFRSTLMTTSGEQL